MPAITYYKKILRFLALFMGSETEIILFDREKIVGIENPIIDEHKIGAPLSEMESLFLNEEKYKETNSVINYRSLSPGGEKLRSATFFIINENSDLEGMLTINKKVKDLIGIREYIHTLINGENSENLVLEQDKNRYFETFNGSFEALMNSVIIESIERYGVSPDRLRPEEKLEIVRVLDEKGTFLIKGSVLEVAKRLHSSEATIYRYLNQLMP